MTADPLKAVLAIAAALLTFTAYATALRPLGMAIGERYAAIDAARATLESDRALTDRLPALERDRARLSAQLVRFHLRDSQAATVDRFLRAIARVAQRDAVSVQRITTDQRPLAELALDISLRGQYRDLIRAVRRLNASDVAAAIVLTSIGNAERRSGMRPELSAAFHVTLLHEASDAAATVSHPL